MGQLAMTAGCVVPPPPKNGVALLLVTGLLTLLSLAALLLVRGAALVRVSSAVGARAGAARLAAESGLEYAASRLLLESGFPGALHRGDDWTCRDPLITHDSSRITSLNPSYSHGEPWTDADGNGRYDPGEALEADRDGDGRFSAWSGRVRGERTRPCDLRFSLAITSPEGGIPLNAGLLWGLDRYDSSGFAPAGNGLPDHRDFRIAYHRGITQALNVLGTLVLPAGHPRRWSAPAGNQGLAPFDVCFLGQDLLERRPVGGYQDWGEVERTLLAAGLGYGASDLAVIRPFVQLGPYEPAGESGRGLTIAPADLPLHVPVVASVAPPEVFRSLWTHLGQGCPLQPLRNIPAEPNAWTATHYPRAGPPIPAPFFFQQNDRDLFNLIFPDEAERLAKATRDLLSRSGGRISWEGLEREIFQRRHWIFERDHKAFDLSRFPVAADSWTQAKAELAIEAIGTAGRRPFLSGSGSFGLGGWLGRGVDRDPADGAQPWSPLPIGPIVRVLYPDGPNDPRWPPDGNDPRAVYGGTTLQLQDVVGPVGLTLAPPVLFDLRAEGGLDGSRAVRSGSLTPAIRIDLTSQEDFENFAGGVNLARRGIAVEDAGRSRDLRRDALPPHRSYPHVRSLPTWDCRSVARAEGNGGYSRTAGALVLSPRELGLGDAVFYWAYGEDSDGMLNDRARRTPPNDFYHEKKGGPFPPPEEPAVNDLNPLFGSAGTKPEVTPSWIFPFPYGAGVAGEIAAFSVEGWLTDGSRLEIYPSWSDPPPSPSWPAGITLRCDDRNMVRLPPPAVSRFWDYDLQINWEDNRPGHQQNNSWKFLDPGQPAFGASHHMVLTFAWDDTEATFRLYINGENINPVTHAEMKIVFTESFSGPLLTALNWASMDEVRLYDEALSPEKVRSLYDGQEDRFVREGTYTSPRYFLGPGSGVRCAQWHGLAPPPFPVPIEAPFLEVKVETFDAAGAPLETIPLPRSGEVYTLASAGKGIASFRYRVRFDCRSLTGRLDDTPIFESIGFTLQKKRGAPVWTSYGR